MVTGHFSLSHEANFPQKPLLQEVWVLLSLANKQNICCLKSYLNLHSRSSFLLFPSRCAFCVCWYQTEIYRLLKKGKTTLLVNEFQQWYSGDSMSGLNKEAEIKINFHSTISSRAWLSTIPLMNESDIVNPSTVWGKSTFLRKDFARGGVRGEKVDRLKGNHQKLYN